VFDSILLRLSEGECHLPGTRLGRCGKSEQQAKREKPQFDTYSFHLTVIIRIF
jgi:hypothetical protein